MGFPAVFASRLMQSLLRGTVALLLKMLPVYLRQHFVDKADCGIYFFVLAALLKRHQVVGCGPSISPKHPEDKCLLYFFVFGGAFFFALWWCSCHKLIRSVCLTPCNNHRRTEVESFEIFKSCFETSYHSLVGSGKRGAYMMGIESWMYSIQ